MCLSKLNHACSQPQSCTTVTCSPDDTFQPSLPPPALYTSPVTPQAAPSVSTQFIPSGSTRDHGVYEAAIETCSSINTSSLDTVMLGPEDYAIESLATSLMSGTAEATTEPFYTGKHICLERYATRQSTRAEYYIKSM